MRVYVETSVFGSAFPPAPHARQYNSNKLFARIRQGDYELVVSSVVEAEIMAGAPVDVVTLFRAMLPFAEILQVTPEARGLRDIYLIEGIVPFHKDDDAACCLGDSCGM